MCCIFVCHKTSRSLIKTNLEWKFERRTWMKNLSMFKMFNRVDVGLNDRVGIKLWDVRQVGINRIVGFRDMEYISSFFECS